MNNEELTKQVNKMINIQKGASIHDLQEMTQVFLSVVKELKLQLEKSISDNKTEVNDQMESTLSSLNDSESNLRGMIAKAEQLSSKDVSDLEKKLMEEIIRVEFLIPTMPEMPDIASLEERISKDIKDTKAETTKDIEAALPKHGTAFRDGLELLTGDDRLDISAIKGFGDRFSKWSNEIMERAVSILDQRTSFLIQKLTNVERTLTNLQGQVNAGVSVGYQTPTGAVDGSNKVFVFVTAPNVVSVDGLLLRRISADTTVNWTVVGTTITLTVAPNFEIYGVA